MTTIGFIIAIAFIGGLFLFSYLTLPKDRDYPEYYRDVWITYKYPKEEEHTKKAWLAINDCGEYIWTLSDDETIIEDRWVISWKSTK